MARPAARANLRFITIRQFYKQPGWHQRSLQRLQSNGALNMCPDVHARRAACGIVRQRIGRFIDDVDGTGFHGGKSKAGENREEVNNKPGLVFLCT